MVFPLSKINAIIIWSRKNKTMKKFLLPLVFVASLLMGCANNQTPSEPEKDELVSISVTGFPKVDYTEGDYFDPTGLKITTTSKKQVQTEVAYAGHESDFTFSPSIETELTTDDTKVTLTYQTLTVDIAITVSEADPTDLGNVDFTMDFSLNPTNQDNIPVTLDTTNSSKFKDSLNKYYIDNSEVSITDFTGGFANLNTPMDLSPTRNTKFMTLGSRTQDCDMTFRFTETIKAIKVYAEPYVKYIAYSTSYTVDLGSTLQVNDSESWDLGVHSASDANETQEKIFTVNSDTIRLVCPNETQTSSQAHRLLIHKIEFEFFTA